jgi:hypothetical protein
MRDGFALPEKSVMIRSHRENMSTTGKHIMRIVPSLILAAFATMVAMPASAQVFITSITAAVPDPNGKVPAFNAVPGAGIETWSNGVAQAVLTAGQSYNYCVSAASATASGKASLSFRIIQGANVIKSATIVTAKDFKIGSNGAWYFCSGYLGTPVSPGAAKLTAIMIYTPTGATESQKVELSVPVLLQ